MAKNKVSPELLALIELEKKAVMEAAEAFLVAKNNQDKDWINTREGKSFAKSMDLAKTQDMFREASKTPVRDFLLGYQSKPIYGRAIQTDFSLARRAFSALPEAIGGFSKEEKAVRETQKALLAAQKSLHKTMDKKLGTRAGRLADEDRSLMEAAEGFTNKRWMLFGEPKRLIGNPFTLNSDSLLGDLGKPFVSGASDLLSIFQGPLSAKERKDNPPKWYERQGLRGIGGSALEFGQGIAKADSFAGLIGAVVGGGIVLGLKVARDALGIGYDALKLGVLRPLELGVRGIRFGLNTAYATAKGGLLVLNKVRRGAALGIGALIRGNRSALGAPAADFTLQKYGAEKEVEMTAKQDSDMTSERTRTVSFQSLSSSAKVLNATQELDNDNVSVMTASTDNSSDNLIPEKNSAVMHEADQAIFERLEKRQEEYQKSQPVKVSPISEKRSEITTIQQAIARNAEAQEVYLDEYKRLRDDGVEQNSAKEEAKTTAVQVIFTQLRQPENKHAFDQATKVFNDLGLGASTQERKETVAIAGMNAMMEQKQDLTNSQSSVASQNSAKDDLKSTIETTPLVQNKGREDSPTTVAHDHEQKNDDTSLNM